MKVTEYTRICSSFRIFIGKTRAVTFLRSINTCRGYSRNTLFMYNVISKNYFTRIIIYLINLMLFSEDKFLFNWSLLSYSYFFILVLSLMLTSLLSLFLMQFISSSQRFLAFWNWASRIRVWLAFKLSHSCCKVTFEPFSKVENWLVLSVSLLVPENLSLF